MQYLRIFFVVSFLIAALSGCGGGAAPPETVVVKPTADVRFELEGLAEGESLLVQDAGVDLLTLTSNGPHLSKMPIDHALRITIGRQPGGQHCAWHKKLTTQPEALEATVALDMDGMNLHCADLIDLDRLYGVVSFNWVDELTQQPVSKSTRLSAANRSQDAYGPVLSGPVGSDFSWWVACFALDDGTQTYKPSYHLCTMVNERGDAHLLAFQRLGQQWVNGLQLYCAADGSPEWADNCAARLRAALPGNLSVGVEALPTAPNVMASRLDQSMAGGLAGAQSARGLELRLALRGTRLN